MNENEVISTIKSLEKAKKALDSQLKSLYEQLAEIELQKDLEKEKKIARFIRKVDGTSILSFEFGGDIFELDNYKLYKDETERWRISFKCGNEFDLTVLSLNKIKILYNHD